MCVHRNVWMRTWMLICECKYAIVRTPVSVYVYQYLSNLISVTQKGEKMTFVIFFVFGNCHLYQYYVMLGFQLRYYKGHTFLSNFTLFSPLQIRLLFLFFLLLSITHFTWGPWCTGVPDNHCPCVSSLFPSGRESYWCFFRKKRKEVKTIISMNEWR